MSMGSPRARSAALLGALALSGFLGCSAPEDHEEQPEAQPVAQAREEPSETQEAPEPHQEPREVAEAQEVLRGAEEAAQKAEDTLDHQKQHETVRQLRDLGIALMDWCRYRVHWKGVGGWDLRERTVDVSRYPEISREELATTLSGFIGRVPATDEWGHPLELRVNTRANDNGHVFLLRSPGRDGVFSDDVYSIGAFDPKSYDDDIVFADGIPIRWPEGDPGYRGFSR